MPILQGGNVGRGRYELIEQVHEMLSCLIEQGGKMANIKCTYRRWRCYDGSMEHQGRLCKHHTWDGYEYDDSCDYGNCEPYRTENGMIAVPFQCRYVQEETVIFEKNVKSWTLDDDELTMRGLSIDVSNIKELVIDGKTIIEGETHE